MKKKSTKLFLSLALAIGMLVPTIAVAADAWLYGWDTTGGYYYNYYRTSRCYHSNSIVITGQVYASGLTAPGYTATVKVVPGGPYSADFYKFDY